MVSTSSRYQKNSSNQNQNPSFLPPFFFISLSSFLNPPLFLFPSHIFSLTLHLPLHMRSAEKFLNWPKRKWITKCHEIYMLFQIYIPNERGEPNYLDCCLVSKSYWCNYFINSERSCPKIITRSLKILQN